MSERNAYVINHNFELIFERLNHDLIPGMETLQKFIVKQRHVNKNIAWFAMGISVYIYFNEKRQYEQRKELNRLKEEIDKLKGE